MFDAVYEINAAASHADFVTAVSAGLTRLIAADVCVVQFLDRTHDHLRFKSIPEHPFTPAEVAYYQANPNAFALVSYYERTHDPRARRVSDVTDAQAWLAGDFYHHCLSRQRLTHALALPIQIDASVIAAVSFNRRGRDFTRRDCALLDAFAPHLRLAWGRQKNPWRVGRRAPRPGSDPRPTPREADVLYWITEGKQNREIAIILGLSLYTVQKHVANLLRKTGAENRHALTVAQLQRATGA